MMARASIPVDLLNPGQVFACLGFLEVADTLLGDAEGGFDWSHKSQVRFVLGAGGQENPFAVVLGFLAKARVLRVAPVGYMERESESDEAGDDDDEEASGGDSLFCECFPSAEAEGLSLPIRLDAGSRSSITVSHWADGTDRGTFKLYSGNRSAAGIAEAMLRGKRSKPNKKHPLGEVNTLGVEGLLQLRREELVAGPFEVLTRMAGSFNMDPRGGWIAIDAGYSPNRHKEQGVAASPVVEILAAIGLEHARPCELGKRQVRYAAWGEPVPPLLARAALGGAKVGVAITTFLFELAMTGKNKVVTFAVEETSR